MPPAAVEATEDRPNQPTSPNEVSSAETKETSVIVSRLDNTKGEMADTKLIELRKDLLEGAEGYINMDEENALFIKNGSLIHQGLSEERLDHRQQPSYVTLTPCQVPSVIQQTDDSTDLRNDFVSNHTLIPNALNSACWLPSHDESVILTLPSSHHLESPEDLTNNLQMISTDASLMDYSHPSFMIEDSFKTNIALHSNQLYHLDGNNRRIWIPESCSIRNANLPTEHINRASPVGVRLTSVHEGDIFMAGELENEELFQQHTVNIERFPNRCWRGSNPSNRAQYEKGTIFKLP